MAAGTASWSDISATANYIHDNALAVARVSNLLIPTVTSLSAQGMFVRTVWGWNSLSFSAHTEEHEETSTAFTKDTLTTLTPANYHCRVDITDERASSDPDAVISAAALELGSAAAAHIDSAIADQFGTTSWAGTIGSGKGDTINWRKITKAYALLYKQGIRPGEPVFCALHPYQWELLLSSNTTAAATVSVAPQFQDRLQVANYFQVPNAYGIIFVVSGNIDVSGTAAYGLMYTPEALAVDVRKSFDIEPFREPWKQSTQFNASMWYVADQYRAAKGICLYHDATTPS